MMESYNELLYEKVQMEYDSFIDELKQLPAEEIISRAYEKVVKEEFVCICEYDELPEVKAKTLYQLENSLESLYQEWMDADYGFMDGVKAAIRNLAESEASKR